MTIDKEKLKALAQATATHVSNDDEYRSPGYDKDCWHDDVCDFANAMSPGAVLALLAEIDRLAGDEQEAADLCDRLSDLLRNTAIEVRGPEEPLRRHGFHDLPSRVKTVVAERDQLKTENEALRKDAERYRWLRRQPDDCSAPRIDICHWTLNGDDSVNEGEGLRGDAADVAIDAAMAKEASHG